MAMDSHNRIEFPTELPQSLREIAEVIGLPIALKIAEQIGGIRIRVPVKFTTDHYLARLIGQELWPDFWQMYQGQHMDLPRNADYLRSVRNQQIVAEYYGEKTAREIALKYQTTERNVYKIVSREHDVMAEAQGDLF